MSLLKKRRSRSETRKMETKNDTNHAANNMGKVRYTHQSPQNFQLPQMEQSLGLVRRRTSAEMISEAKTFLGDVGSSNTTNHNQVATKASGMSFFVPKTKYLFCMKNI